jgi:phosphoribosylaminoimidazolecarboxamide formyltransferase/IMP cyclohydrolase
MPKIARAILSCNDKNGLVEFAEFLAGAGVEIISTSGTLDVLRGAGIAAESLAEFTGMPELMDGRVKTLHPHVHAGLLGVRDNKLHAEQMQEHGMDWIDLVVVNLRPMEALLGQPQAGMGEIFEQIDIGGMAMIRSAAKNFRYVTVAVNPSCYPLLMHEMRANEGEVSFPTRYRLAQEAFQACANYDQAIADYLKRTQPQEM